MAETDPIRVDEELLERCGALKRELVEFAKHNRFGRAYRQMMRDEFAELDMSDELAAVNALDHFALQHRLHDGSTVLERFCAERRSLTEQDREILLGWNDVVYGLFEIEGKEDGALVTINLIDQLGYRIHSNQGRVLTESMPDGDFLHARVVPLGDDWIVSGYASVFPADRERTVCQMAADLGTRNPAEVYRNQELLKRGWQIHHAQRRCFVEFFGSDLVVVPGPDLEDRMRDFMGYYARMQGGDGERPPDYPVPELDVGQTVAAAFDETDGIMFWVDFGLVEEAMVKPELVQDEPYYETVRAYLEDNSVSPEALRRLGERDPDVMSELMRAVTGRRDLTWETDGEALLREYKPEWFEAPALPCVSVMSERVTNGLKAS